MDNAKLVNIAFTSHFKLSLGSFPSNEDENDYVSQVSYANVV